MPWWDSITEPFWIAGSALHYSGGEGRPTAPVSETDPSTGVSHVATTARRLGSAGERILQQRYGSRTRAEAFYREQVTAQLNDAMRDFVGRMEMVFVSTADAGGNCDCSFRSGPRGFVRALDEHTLAYPEYRGNGVMASQGNIVENGHVGLLFVDFFETTVGLHVNGRAHIAEGEEFAARVVPGTEVPDTAAGRPTPERWVVVEVEEAYIHCSKHVPLLAKQDKAIAWGTDDVRLKGGDYFRVSAAHRVNSTPPT